MNLRFRLLATAVCLLGPLASARASNDTSITMRAILVDPVNPVAELFVRGPDDSLARIDFIPNQLSESQSVVVGNGTLPFFDSPEFDPENPREHFAGSANIPADAASVIAVIVPNRAESGPAYRVIALTDSPEHFPMAGARVLNLVPVRVAVEAGEHKLTVAPGKSARLPAVRKVNDFNMAQTNFYYRDKDSWLPFTERQLKYLDGFRRIFVVQATPGATRPTVVTVRDVVPAPPPEE